MSRDAKFIDCIKNSKYTSVNRYLKYTYWGQFVCNMAVSSSIIVDDKKMFDLLLNYPTIRNNLTNHCIISAIMSETKHDKSHYFIKILNIRTFSHDELIDTYLQISRLKKLYGIRRKMLKR